jgi:FkbM family methyltransferase
MIELRRVLARALPAGVKQRLRRWLCGPMPASLPAAAPPAWPTVPLALAPGRQLAIVPGDLISDGIAATGVWEAELSQRLVALARAGGTLLEVGANIGYFSVLWAAQSAACRVLALEPAWRNLELLHHNLRLNGLTSQVDVLPIAAGHRTGLMRFDPGPPAQTGWGGVVTDARAGTLLVAMLPLDELLPGDFVAAVLKIDVEGADTWVLQGCRRLLAERRAGVVFFEQNLPRLNALGIDPGAAERLLAELGYRVEPITPVGAEVVEYAAYPS